MDKQIPFARELIVALLRLAVRLAFRLGHCTLAELKHLLGIAIYRELRSHGLSLSAMSLTLNCSLRTTKSFSSHSRKLGIYEEDRSAVDRVLQSLSQGPVPEPHLQRLCPTSTDFDVPAVLASLLIKRGFASRTRRGSLEPTSAYAEQSSKAWNTPAEELTRAYCASLFVLRALMKGPKSQAQLRANWQRPPEELQGGVDFLIQRGDIQKGADENFAFSGQHQLMLPASSQERFRVGFLELLEKLGWFLDFVTDWRNVDRYGQRTFQFQARQEDLFPFMIAHRDWVLKALMALEERAEKEGGGEACYMFWGIAPRVPTH